MRNLVRHRDNLIRSASREVLHLQKAMEQMNLKLDNVFTDILGKSGQAIIKAILDGERNPKKLSSMADPRCKKSREEIEKSLEATWDEEHLFTMQQSQQLYDLKSAASLVAQFKIKTGASKLPFMSVCAWYA